MNWKRLVAGCVVGVCALAILLLNADLGKIGDALRQANSWWIATALLALATNLVLRSVRWVYLLKPIGSFDALRNCFSIYVISYAANILIPLRAGDVLRAILFGRKFKVSKSAVLTSVALEHLFDGFAIVMIFAIALGATGAKSTGAASGYLFLVSGTAFIGFLGAYILATHKKFALRLLGHVERLPFGFTKRLSLSLASVLTALQLLRDIRSLIRVAAITAALWACGWAVVSSFMLAVGLDLPWHAPLLVIAVANLGFMVPTVPGNVGVAHLLYVSALVWLGVELNVAFAFALLMHGIPHIVIVLLGLFAMWLEGFSLFTLPSEGSKTTT
jgi:glycosyltransferase 2 family protein